MPVHTWGRIAYLDATGGETGREWFRITRNADGSRTLRATCEMDAEGILRDVVHSVDDRWRPVDAYVRLHVGGAFAGSAWFRFGDDVLECEAQTVAEGRVSQRLAVPRRPQVFAAHPLACDGWQAAAFDHAAPSPRQSVLSANCSPRPDGGSGPLAGVDLKELDTWASSRCRCPPAPSRPGGTTSTPRGRTCPRWSFGCTATRT